MSPWRRCAVETESRTRGGSEWELAFDTFSRRYATDIIWSALAGTIVVSTVALGAPLLGMSTLVAVTGVFGGFGTIVGLFRYTRYRRRRAFLLGAAMPRAYLPDRT